MVDHSAEPHLASVVVVREIDSVAVASTDLNMLSSVTVQSVDNHSCCDHVRWSLTMASPANLDTDLEESRDERKMMPMTSNARKMNLASTMVDRWSIL